LHYFDLKDYYFLEADYLFVLKILDFEEIDLLFVSFEGKNYFFWINFDYL
jgi:hypothetical protein